MDAVPICRMVGLRRRFHHASGVHRVRRAQCLLLHLGQPLRLFERPQHLGWREGHFDIPRIDEDFHHVAVLVGFVLGVRFSVRERRGRDTLGDDGTRQRLVRLRDGDKHSNLLHLSLLRFVALRILPVLHGVHGVAHVRGLVRARVQHTRGHLARDRTGTAHGGRANSLYDNWQWEQRSDVGGVRARVQYLRRNMGCVHSERYGDGEMERSTCHSVRSNCRRQK
mmetsp:Transcript_8959/g.19359  ORF Transcript_8959/g.19359 Transcript_8959/m.19359 type:complete len:224 (-) Transcript_8959:535-1206(-)